MNIWEKQLIEILDKNIFKEHVYNFLLKEILVSFIKKNTYLLEENIMKMIRDINIFISKYNKEYYSKNNTFKEEEIILLLIVLKNWNIELFNKLKVWEFDENDFNNNFNIEELPISTSWGFINYLLGKKEEKELEKLYWNNILEKHFKILNDLIYN